MSHSLYTLKPISKPVETSSISSNWKYRQYMQSNAKDIMKYNSMQYFHQSGNNPYHSNEGQPTNKYTPHLFSSVHDTQIPSTGYCDSDLKRQYIQKEQMRAKMVAPIISTSQFR